MNFDPVMYKTNRSEVHDHYNSYVKAIQNNFSSSDLVEAKNKVLNLWYYELLILQSSIDKWTTLMKDSSLNFRRELCANAYNLERADIMAELNLSSGAVSNLFNESTRPQWPRPFQLTVLFEHPWQLVNYDKPNMASYTESPEYFEENVSQDISLNALADVRSHVRSIKGYVVSDAHSLFQQESNAITGRWVTTYPEFDYFEFHLNHEPLMDRTLKESLKKLFPQAKHVITTYRPFKPMSKRSLWVIIPKDEALPSYGGMLHELKEYRERTEYHQLR